MMPGKMAAGKRTFRLSVQFPKSTNSMFGIIRRAPSSQPMYQSGCEPAVIWSGM